MFWMMLLVMLMMIFVLQFTGNSFLYWVFMEMVSLIIVVYLLVVSKNVGNLYGVLNYFLVQGLGGLIVLLGLVWGILEDGGIYGFFNNSHNNVMLILILGLFIKMGFFPFFYMVIMVMLKLGYKECFIIIILPKIIPLYLFLNMNLSMFEGLLYLVILMSLFTAGVNGLKAADIRELMGWSSINQTGWMMLLVMCDVMLFLLFYVFYLVLMFMFWYYVKGVSSSSFFGVSHLMGKGDMGVIMTLLLGMIGGFSPFALFLFKMFGLLMVVNSFGAWGVGFLFLMLTGSFLFYMRIFQFLLCVTSSYGSLGFSYKDSNSGAVSFFLMLVLTVTGFIVFYI
uniref:NADH-ubiquinone oxidoreductase chain 2 n=1 Tax=Microcosmus sulcatus TaxID=341086 RepID=D2YVG5_9ASCI|nr:NADH dehydrogenase subunit 2 [Microcosmus sulcatus]CAL23088.2 NADH dehydrogenase subunit 2 [Microcosmus sulcatus]